MADRGRRIVLSSLAGFLAAAAIAAPEPPASGGRLTGTILLGTRLSARKMKFNLYPDAAGLAAAAPARLDEPRPGTEQDASAEMANVVVYLERADPAQGAAPRPAARPQIRQVNEEFVPHVLPIVKGTMVEFPNGDGIYHNVFSLSKAATFDLGRYPKGGSKSVAFPSPGIVKVFCHIHADMSAVVLVLDNAFFAVPDARGRYVIEGIPPGDYTAVAWHERARPLHRTIRIEAGREAEADFSIPLIEPPDGR